MANFSISYIYTIKNKVSPTLKKITGSIKNNNLEVKKSSKMWAMVNRAIFTSGVRMAMLRKKSARFFAEARKNAKRLKGELRGSWDQLLGIGATAMAISFPVKRAMEFETAMAGVAKAANLTKGTAQFNKMRGVILDMTKEIPKTANEIAAIFEAGARLGISQKDLPDFARLTAKTSVAFGLMAEEAGDSLASISAKMGVPINKMGLLMDAVNQLENTTSAKGKEMIEILGRVSGTAKSINMDPKQMAGLAAVANQITVSPELAASGINMMISRMQKVPKLQKALLKNPTTAIKDMLKQISKLDKAAQFKIINKIFGEEAGRFVTSLVNSLDVYDKTMGQVADTSKYAGSMQKEFATAAGTSESKVKLAQNAMMRTAIALGAKLLPAVNAGAVLLSKFANVITIIVNNTGPLVPMLVAFAAAMATVKAAILGARIAMLAFNVAMAANPIGIVISALAALAVGVVWAYDKFKPFREFVDSMWDKFLVGIQKIKPVLGMVADAAMALLSPIAFLINKIIGGIDSVMGKSAALQTEGGGSPSMAINRQAIGSQFGLQPTLNPADAARGANISGTVTVDINAPKGSVKEVKKSGSNLNVNKTSYTGLAGVN